MHDIKGLMMKQAKDPNQNSAFGERGNVCVTSFAVGCSIFERRWWCNVNWDESAQTPQLRLIVADGFLRYTLDWWM